MIPEIKELNFPNYATLSQATCTLQDMAEKTITTQVKIDGDVTPDFSYDWEIEFKGEKYIMPLRQPQAAKENTSLNSTIDLTFQHWAQYQLKRQYFFTIQPVESGTSVADKYITSVSLNLKDFCALFNRVLDYYFKGAITIDLNTEWEFAEEPTTIEISYSYLWDVLIQFYDLWAVRWQIEPNGSTDKYVIKVGYPVAEVNHIFEYGFKGGLLKVERQVQNENIRNMLLGRGGEKNLPYRYFKDIDPNNPSFPADPDWIPELRNIYFSELRGKTFRDYVKGWKTNPNRQLTDVEGNPIYPYIVTYPENSSVQTQALPKIERSSFYVSPFGLTSINIPGNEPINIPQGYQGNFQNGIINVETVYEQYDIYHDTYTDIPINDGVDVTTEITLINRNTGKSIASVDIPSGEYDYNVRFNLQSKYGNELRVDLTDEGLKLIKTPCQEVKPNVGTPISIEPYDKEYAATSWAYQRGHKDEKFDPVEFVKDDTSIVNYGELMGALENNEEIYPSIQGVSVDPYGLIDEAVDVEQITSDDIEETVENNSVISNIPNGVFSYTTSELATNSTASTTFPKVSFTVPAGKNASLLVLDNVEILKIYVGDRNANKVVNKTNFGAYAQIEKKDVKVYDSTTNEERSSVCIPEGSYYYVIDIKVKYISAAYKNARITVGIDTPRIQYSTPQDEKWGKTFDIWIKNIWGSEKRSDETDAQYAERVWRPILGDREGSETKVVFSTGMLSTSEDYEFVIAKGGIHFDTSKTLNGVPSHWRLTLGKSDADLESTGLYVPSTMRQGKPGDHFFFAGIDMPHQYVVWAEERLDNYKTENLDEVKDIKPTWVVSLDKVRINNKQQGELQPLISQLRVGDSLRLADKRFIINDKGSETAYEILYLQSITYTYNEPSSNSPALIPDIEVVLSDKYETVANPIATLSGEISALSKQIGAMSNVEQVVRAIGDKLYLRKDGIADRSMSPTEFFSLVNGRNFRSGIVGGASWGIYQDANGNWVIEADRFKARQDFEVNNLAINQIIARGGMIIESAAQIEVTRIAETAEGYVCYFDQKMGSIANLFHIDDVAYCNRFTPENTALKFYKRRVIAVAVDSITLTKGYDPVQLPDDTIDTGVNGAGIPEVGDVIVQYGNYTDSTRCYAKVRDVIGGGYERYLEGLDSVNAAGKEYYFVGKHDEQNPRWFIGYKDRNYAEWRDGNLYIKGNIEMGPDSSGLSKLPEFQQVQESADAAADAADAANKAAEKINSLEIGGLNLIDGSTLTDQPTNWRINRQSTTFEHFQGYDCMLTSTEENIKGAGVFGNIHDDEFNAGDTITFSVWVYSTVKNADIWLGYEFGDSWPIIKIPEANKWVRVSRMLDIPSGNRNSVVYNMTPNSTIAFRNVKAERGNIATTWSLSLADQKAISGLQFIKQIFPSGLINNTATVSQLLAVRNEHDNIVAGIYGGGVKELEDKYGFLDKAHGKLMIFAGANEGINDNKVASAATRIYEDGTLITSKLIAIDADIAGKITATSGKIGKFNISSLALVAEEGENKMSLDADVIKFTGADMHLFLGVHNIGPSILSPLNINVSREEYGALGYANIGISLNISGISNGLDNSPLYGNHALYITQGDICGFRMRTRRINGVQNLDKMDSVILCWGAILTLPKDPEDGQLYFIKQIANGGVTLKVGATGHYINDGRTNRKTEWRWDAGEIVIVIWDAQNKIWHGGYTNIN